MRMLLKYHVPSPPALRSGIEHAAIEFGGGKLDRSMKIFLDPFKPEAAYFCDMDGRKTALVFFDLEHPSQIPALTESLALQGSDYVQLMPVMTVEDIEA